MSEPEGIKSQAEAPHQTLPVGFRLEQFELINKAGEHVQASLAVAFRTDAVLPAVPEAFMKAAGALSPMAGGTGRRVASGLRMKHEGRRGSSR